MNKDWQADKASGGDNASRNAEARKILYDLGLKDAGLETDKEQDFVASLIDRFEQYGERTVISSKQLFWLRDLKERYL
jgi:hypothetical protein